MAQNPSDQWTSRAMWLLMATPLLLLLLFLTLVAHKWIGLGHWPDYSTATYRTAAYLAHQRAVIWLGYFSIWGAVPLWLALLCAWRFRASWSLKIPLLQAAAFIAGWAAIAALLALAKSNLWGLFLR